VLNAGVRGLVMAPPRKDGVAALSRRDKGVTLPPLDLDERLGLESPYRLSRIVVGRPILIRRVRIDLSI
jgi:hypothetical protein